MAAQNDPSIYNPATASLGQGTGGTGSYMPPAPPQGGTLQPGQGSPGDVGYNGNVPGIGENVAGSLLGYYGQNGTPSPTNNAQQAYSSFRDSTPQNMSPYYDNAVRNANNDLNKQMAARGQYGSSNAVGQISNADTNIRAQQAKDEAGYGLQRAQLGGSLASGSDASSETQGADARAWMSGLSDLGFRDQSAGMTRYEQGNQDSLDAAKISSGIQGSVGGAEVANDQNLLIQSLMAQGMSYSDAVTAAQNKTAAGQAGDARTAGTIESGATAAAMLL